MRRIALPVAFAMLLSLAVPLAALAADPPGTVVPGVSASKIDPAALALLKKSADALLALQSYRTEYRIVLDYRPDTSRQERSYSQDIVVMQKPNLVRSEEWPMTVDSQGRWVRERTEAWAWAAGKAVPFNTILSDGRTLWKKTRDEYTSSDAVSPSALRVGKLSSGFFSVDNSPYGEVANDLKYGNLLEARLLGRETVNGVLCDKVWIARKVGDFYQGHTTYYIGPDSLLRRQVLGFHNGKKPDSTENVVMVYSQVNPPLGDSARVFAFHAPPGVVVAKEQKPVDPHALLEAGVVAPTLSAVDKDGATVNLSDFKGKVVVLDFWASWCGPCIAAMPHNQEVVTKLQAENLPVVMLAIDNDEQRPAAFADWVKAHPEYDALRFVFIDHAHKDVAGKEYHAPGIPTQYVVDAQGVIRASFVGYDGPTDDLERAVRAALKPLPTP